MNPKLPFVQIITRESIEINFDKDIACNNALLYDNMEFEKNTVIKACFVGN